MTRISAPRIAVSAIAAAGIIAAAPMAHAVTCFSAFGGTVNYNFNLTTANFSTVGTYAAPGVTFGALSPCAGLSKWPVMGTLTVSKTSAVLAWRAETVDAAGCGAVDEIVGMTPGHLTGTLQLHNDRNNFSNTSAFTQTACLTPAIADVARPLDAADPTGN
jgi:hypothetical protein